MSWPIAFLVLSFSNILGWYLVARFSGKLKREVKAHAMTKELEQLAVESSRTWYEKFCEAKGYRSRSENIPVLDEWPEEIEG